MFFSEKLTIWFKENPTLSCPEKFTRCMMTPWHYVHHFPSRNRIHFCCSNRLLSSPSKNSHQLLCFSLSMSANSTIFLLNPAEQIHRPHPLSLKCFRKTTHWNGCARKMMLRAGRTSYCLLHGKDVFRRGIPSATATKQRKACCFFTCILR